jgi:Divergent InlB B-repeat domain
MRTPVLLLAATALLVAVPLAAASSARTTANSATTDDPTSVTSTAATLHGHTSQACSGSTGFKGSASALNSSQSSGIGNATLSKSVSGLSPGTSYSYYAYVIGCSGALASGSPVTFTTLARLNISITGSGKVTSGGISCTASCSADVTNGAGMTLTATPSSGFRFASWSGICAGQGATCTTVPVGTASVGVTFTAVRGLTVTKAGDGTGTVTSGGGEIACGSTCSASFASGSAVTLTATPAADSLFVGWSGGCSGTAATCNLTLGSDQATTATFSKARKLSVGIHGRGAVTSAPAGISTCTTACFASFPPGTGVALTATAERGWRFTGWSGGGCSGTGPCALTLAADTVVNAQFTPLYTLRVIGVGGKGVVRSSPNGILCGRACSKAYLADTVVTLRASAAKGFRFAGWAGDCRGAKTTCTVKMRNVRTAVAKYAKT